MGVGAHICVTEAPICPNPKDDTIPTHQPPCPPQHTVHLPDSNPRAFVYVSGRTPNRWGYMDGGKKLVDYLASAAPDVRILLLRDGFVRALY